MKAKIIGILVCIMLMTTILTTAQNLKDITAKDESDEIKQISSYDVEAPVWEVGYKWTYKIYRIIVNYQYPDLGFYMDLKIDNFPLEVTKVTEDFYELTFDSSCNGFSWFFVDLGDGPINISFELISPTIEGTIILDKTSMGIKEVHPTISGEFDVEITEQPYIELPFKLHKKVHVTINLDIIFDNPNQPIVKFPFNLSECWGLPSENFTLFCTIESPLFENIDNANRKIINPILTILNETIDGPMISRLLEFSNILKDILPIIDVCYILTEYLDRECVFKTQGSELPNICCLSKDWITVTAGTFECYNISIFSMFGINIANIYYNTTLGAIVKVIGNLEDILPSVSNIHIELISYDL